MTVRLVVLWGRTEDENFTRRYREEHLPLVRQLPGLRRVTVSQVRSRSHSVLAELVFVDAHSMKAAFASPSGTALLAHTNRMEDKFGVEATSLVVLEPLVDIRPADEGGGT